jgi:hypothetical protein
MKLTIVASSQRVVDEARMLTNPATPAGPTRSRDARERSDDHPAFAPAEQKGEEPKSQMRFGDPGRHHKHGGPGCQVTMFPRSVCEHEPQREERRPLRLHEHRPRSHPGEGSGARRKTPDLRGPVGPLHTPDREHHGENQHREFEQRPEPVRSVQRQDRCRQHQRRGNRCVDEGKIRLAVGSDQRTVQRLLQGLAVEVARVPLAEQRAADVERREITPADVEAAHLRPDHRVGDEERRGYRDDQAGRSERSAHLRQPKR